MGCFAIKTDLKAKEVEKGEVHGRYKDLKWVEKAFREKSMLDVRPVYLRREDRTRGYLLV